MPTDEISHLLSRDPLMCRPYDVVAKDCMPHIVDTYPTAIVCNTHDADRPGEHWIAMYVDAERRGDYFDSYGLQPQHGEFANFMNAQCSEWTSNDRTLQSPLSTVCGQYCVAFLMFRCRNVSMHAFTRLFTTDLVANDCRVFDWLAAVNKKMMMMVRCVRVRVTSTADDVFEICGSFRRAIGTSPTSHIHHPMGQCVRVRTFVYFIAGC